MARDLAERAAAEPLLDPSDGRYVRVVVVDAAGHRSAPGPELDLSAGPPRAVPLPPAAGAIALARPPQP